ncbi:MAG: ComEA family DNA-binding protein [bacterium]|nr:ComEA family DNA-binding protein [bacterium]
MFYFSRLQKIIVIILTILFGSGIAAYFIVPAKESEPISKEEIAKNIQDLKKELEDFEIQNQGKNLPPEFEAAKKKLDQAIECTITEEDFVKSFKLLSESRQDFSEAKLILAKQEKTVVKNTETPKPDPKPKPKPEPKPQPKPEPKPSENTDTSKTNNQTYDYLPPVTPTPVVNNTDASFDEINKKALEEKNNTSTSNDSTEYNYKPLTKNNPDSKESETKDPATPKPSPSPSGGKVNLNTATSEELQTLKGIGPSKASSIIEYRNSHGAFKRIEDIQNVSGIGPKTFESLKPYITVGSGDEVTESPDTESNYSSSDTPPSSGKKININTANVEELDTIPGIGPKTAQSIIDYRDENGPFKSVDDLANLPRIGPKTLEKIKPYLTVGD